MASYSSAPWSVRFGVCRNDHPDTSADVHGAHGEFVADCGCHELANGNARLIAAAPDLLAALKPLLFAPATARERRLIEEAKAAIAKAEGA